jgi:hypothetical protein
MNQRRLLALTLWHPWPWAIVHGKPVENRDWAPPSSLLRPGEWLALHGGKFPAGRALQESAGAYQWIVANGLAAGGNLLSALIAPYASAIFAVVRYAGAVTAHESPWFVGPVGWTWDRLVVLPEPVRCKGHQKLWTVPDDVLVDVRDQFKAAA